MTSENYAYWLQGFFELSNTDTLNESQVQTIKNHLNMVFIHHIDPKFPADQQQALDNTHRNRFVEAMQAQRDSFSGGDGASGSGSFPMRSGAKC